MCELSICGIIFVFMSFQGALCINPCVTGFILLFFSVG